MLATVLAVLLGLGSVIFYVAAFVYPEVHRRSDFLWSGLGLLYAAVLWFSSAQMTGLVLLGQVVAVALLLGLGWQTLTVRRQKTHVYQQTPIVLTPEVVGGWAKSKLNDLRIVPDENIRAVRLDRRAAEDPATLSARLDPRRRPAYDYEFVEDGVAKVQQVVQQGELFAFSAGLSTGDAVLPMAEADTSRAEAESTYAAPPSVEAEVVAVEKADVEKADAEKADIEKADIEKADIEKADIEKADIEKADVEQAKLEQASESVGADESAAVQVALKNEAEVSKEDEVSKEVAVTALVSEELSESGAAEAEIAEAEIAEAEIAGVELLIEKTAEAGLAIANEDAEADHWVGEESTTRAIAEDDLLDDWAIAEGDDQVDSVSKDVKPDISAKRSGAVRKPSLLKMPVILVIWAKDVVVSLVKPKPAKPVIEIPRREPVVDSAAVDKTVTNDFRYNSEPKPDRYKREESEEPLEESNWID